MGTNFYWQHKPCQHCNRHDPVHVGKRSAGWSFGFRAWPHVLLNEDNPSWGYSTESPFGFPVMSRADWRTVFTTTSGHLVDEYGGVVPDPVAWLDALDKPDLKQRTWENGQRGIWSGSRDEHRDDEGFHFGAYEFS